MKGTCGAYGEFGRDATGEWHGEWCGKCAGCEAYQASTTCECYSSYRMPGTYKHAGYRVCSRCHLRRRPSRQRAMTRQPNEDNATILEMDELGTLG